MAKQKSLQLPSYIQRNIPIWSSPQWLAAERWRQLVANQPIAEICVSKLIANVESSDWEVRPKQSKLEDRYAEDIEHYTEVFNPSNLFGGLSGFDDLIAPGISDLLTLPIGMNYEVVRFDPNEAILNEGNSVGHVAELIYIDGATLFPTYDRDIPIKQVIPEDITKSVYFTKDEIARKVSKPSSWMRRWGYGSPPPEKIYLAINMLYRSDQYYANLLLDTPEAGILDLGSFTQDEAQDWVVQFRETFTGIDPFKIPVLYEMDRAPTYIQFGRPPTELMLDAQTLKFAAITAAGYGLTLTDLGITDPERTLAGKIRDEQISKRSGFGVVKEKIRTWANIKILPPYLEWVWIENNPEAKSQQARSFMMFVSSLEKAKNSGFITEETGLEELKKEGYITVEAELPEEEDFEPPALTETVVNEEVDRVEPSEGGRGEVRRNQLGGPDIPSVPRDSEMYKKMSALFRDAFDSMMERMDLDQLIAKATELEYDTIELTQMSDWLVTRIESHFIEKAEDDELDDILDDNKWWQLIIDLSALALVYVQAFSEGATNAANIAWRSMFDNGLRDIPNPDGFHFNLVNTQTLRKLDSDAARLVTQVNEGTKFYLNRIIKSAVDQGLSSPNIAQLIRDGASLDDIIDNSEFQSSVRRTISEEIQAMTDNRINSIVNTEIARAETDGRVEMWGKMGLTRKRWVHTGVDVPCIVCRGNIDLGFVEMDYLYNSVFGPSTASGPPAHPQVDHCAIEFDEVELIDNADQMNLWDGS